ncbi:formyltetrahydrofolate deformylase [Psychrosphaera aquimarina]|uniref:Formyltetrahydrofolate deformylase n=1 Tax=Psychrosphaera aquimarina TaxID=2044854 RepID=A0ABU3R389_9GAMM|nr:formyltetrahydrofolate deformylase [Psychrosphaera aquimarina]MDU0114123.1 formyltetrahydrofolate deformylase [Psychrosphaera aquimarina]
MNLDNKLTLTISCPDRVGLVAAVSQFLAKNNVSILDANHHTDSETQWFFMRHEMLFDPEVISFEDLNKEFTFIAEHFQMKWAITPKKIKNKVVLLASKESHCLTDILHRWHEQELDCEIVAVIANHKEMEKFANWYQLPFHHIDFKTDKSAAFTQLEQVIEQYNTDTIVLARFMQIFPDALCQKFKHQVINIHHSFLPSFVGAKPYHQAYERGVKLIGATCHYVTADLDAGPIIEQEISRISHSDSVQDMVRKGKECEKSALARGLRYHLEHRVMVQGNKTVIFAD